MHVRRSYTILSQCGFQDIEHTQHPFYTVSGAKHRVQVAGDRMPRVVL